MLKKPKKIKQFKRLGCNDRLPHPYWADRYNDRSDQQTGRVSKVSVLRPTVRNMPIQTQLRPFYGNIKRLQASRYMAKARSTNQLLQDLELRLDVVLFRTGLSSNSIYTAKQLINHGHVLVNGQKIYKPSYKVELGDFVQLDPKIKPWIASGRSAMMQLKNRTNDWEINWKLLIATLVQLPNQDSVHHPIPLNLEQAVG